MNNIIQIVETDNEPRVRDLDLAAALEFGDAHMIRRIIARNYGELETHGEVSVTVTETSAKGGRPGKAYLLNEAQALVICALSRTSVAVEVRRQLIAVFTARRCKPVQVREHRRSLPHSVARDPWDVERDRLIGFFKAFRDQPEALADWAIGIVVETSTRILGPRPMR